jgi:predicted NACHT family NTPase
MSEKFDKWLPKFPANNVNSIEEHIDTFYVCFQNHPLNNDDEDVVMKLFVASLVENERKRYNNLPNKSIKTWKAFHDAFMKRWGTKNDGKLLLV